MAILMKFSNHEKDLSTIHRSGRTANFFEDSSGLRTTVNSAPSFSLASSASFCPRILRLPESSSSEGRPLA
jgi:hypothetical protein